MTHKQAEDRLRITHLKLSLKLEVEEGQAKDKHITKLEAQIAKWRPEIEAARRRTERIAKLEATITTAAFERAEAISTDDVVVKLRQRLADAEALLVTLIEQIEKGRAIDDHGHAIIHLKVVADTRAYLAKRGK